MPNFRPLPNRGLAIVEFPLKAAESFTDGAFVVLDANEEVTECGADPAAVLGISVEGGVAGVDAKEILTDRCGVALGGEESTFLMAANAAMTAANVGHAYGVVKGADGVWVIDLSETVNVVVFTIYLDVDRSLMEVRLADGVYQLGA